MTDRNQAWAIVTEYTANESLRRHMQAVEVAMRAYAPRFGGDPAEWGVVGLLHDFDYERYPDVAVEGHPVVGSKILRERGVPEPMVKAILAHAEEITGVKPETSMEKTLVAVDELTGFLIAVALVRPSKSILDVELKSVNTDQTLDKGNLMIDRRSSNGNRIQYHFRQQHERFRPQWSETPFH
jgi:putative nucleotidyltransferase with HDIG domain